MNFKTILREAFIALNRNWIRSVLTILGIAVGVGSFICVIAIGNAGTSSIEDQLQSLGDNFVWIEAGSRARNGMKMGARGSRTLVLSDAHAIMEQVPLIKSMSPNVDGRIQVVYGGENWSTQFRGVTPEFLEIRRWTLRLGTFFTAADVEAAAPVCVLGQTVVENLFGEENPIGKVIRTKAVPCKVVGVLLAKGFSATGQDQDDFVVMPFTFAQKRITGTFWLDDIFCSAVTRQLQFLSEATALSVLGGLFGLLAGVISSAAVENLFQFPTKLTPDIFLIGGLFSAGIGILFGYYPARKASQLDPIQGLRYE